MNQTQLQMLTGSEPAAGAEGAVRTRTYSWTDPSATLAALRSMPGIEVLSAIGRGDLPAPPLSETLGIEPVEVGYGRITFAMTPQEMHYNPLGTVHGGVIATLLDTAAACAVHSVLPTGVGYVSLDLTVKYLRPVTADTGRVIVTGTLLSKGSRTALAEGRLTDSRDRLLAYASSSCMILEPAA
jgi:uncharacterized protein (TIGR00369 family)